MDLVGVGVGAVGLLQVAVVIYVVTKAAAAGTIDVNSAVGIRTKTTRSSQQAWEVAHRAAFPWVRGASVLCVTAAVVALAGLVFLRGSAEIVVGALVLGYVGLLVLMFVATAAGHRAVRRSESGGV